MKNAIAKLRTRLHGNRDKKNKGFTLVELIIVIALIAALSVAAVIGYQSLSTSANETLEKQEAAFIVRTLNQYNALLKEGKSSADYKDGSFIPTIANLTAAGALKLSGGPGGNGLLDLDLTITTGTHTDQAVKWVTFNATSLRWEMASVKGA